MATTAWNNLELCTRPQIEKRVRGIQYLVQTPDAKKSEAIDNAIEQAKEELKNKILGEYQAVFANSLLAFPTSYATFSQWFLDDLGYTWDQLDSLCDYLFNPSVLKTTIVDCVVWKLFESEMVSFNASASGELQSYFMDQAKYWKKEFECKWDGIRAQLKFDINQDGKVDPIERTATRNSFFIS